MSNTNSKDVHLSLNVIIEDGVILEGHVSIGQGTFVSAGTRLKNVTIGENCKIWSSYIFDSKVGNNCEVGPFAHLREKTNVGHDCRVGNFVELKKTVLENNVKAAHLTYLGDCFVGEYTNIGCGVISANYDGKDKHETHIGKHCFIGSNVTLVAPLVIGDNATIAASSVITKDVPSDALAIERSEQVNKLNYKKGKE
jgi:bifunctional UDP-N-acetylglucosamine pyrophosphorylase/glucosamine-1-phosphate N-acetyltransferase